MKKIWIYLFAVALFCSCGNKGKNCSYTLQTVDTFLNYHLASDVKVPLMMRSCIDGDGKDYFYFRNGILPDLLIYDIHNETLVKRIKFKEEGPDAIEGGFSNGIMMTDCNHIYISSKAQPELYATDTTGCIRWKMSYAETADGYKFRCCFQDNGAFQFVNGKLYLPQGVNFRFGKDLLEKSALLCSLDTLSGEVEALPVKFPPVGGVIRRGSSGNVNANYKFCFNGQELVYSFAYMDDLMVVNPLTHQVEYKAVRSRYIGEMKPFSSDGTNDAAVQKNLCEYPAYSNIMYDSYNKVYYRVVYVPQEIDRKVDILSLYRTGRKQFSIMILDEDFNVIGEHLFPPYTYNPRLSFVSKGKLYISLNNIMNPDYSDDVIRFQMVELVKDIQK